MIKFACPSCRKPIRVDDNQAAEETSEVTVELTTTVEPVQ